MSDKTERRYGLGGKVALVTGGSQGVGRSIALLLAKDGCDVAISGRNQEKLDTVAREIQDLGAKYLTIRADVRDSSDVANMIAAAIDEFDRIDFLVNNAGVTSSSLVHEMTEEQWDLVLDTNLKGAFLCARAVIPHMIEQKFGSIVNLCSIASFLGQEGRANYAASKAGLLALTKVLAQELSPQGIRVNAVAPGLLDTDMIRKNISHDVLDNLVTDRKPLGRLGKPDEVAEVVLFLLSEGASYITGESILIDGGLLSGYFFSKKMAGKSIGGGND